jgi:hypothetical protein
MERRACEESESSPIAISISRSGTEDSNVFGLREREGKREGKFGKRAAGVMKLIKCYDGTRICNEVGH